MYYNNSKAQEKKDVKKIKVSIIKKLHVQKSDSYLNTLVLYEIDLIPMDFFKHYVIFKF